MQTCIRCNDRLAVAKKMCQRCYYAHRNGQVSSFQLAAKRNFIRGSEGILSDSHGKEWRIDIGDFEKCRHYVWAYTHSGYAISKMGYLHRFLCPQFKRVDHKDRDTFNNHRSNLREGRWINVLNTTRRKVAASGYRGITAMRDCWQVRITVKGKRIALGTYKTIQEAKRVLSNYARKNGLSEFY